MTTAKAKAAAAAATPAAAPAPANDAAKQIEQAVSAGKQTIEQVVKASQDAASKAQTAAFKSYEDAIASAKENLDVVIKAGQTLAHGLQDIGKSVVGLAQLAVEDGVEASKKLFAAKTIHDAVEIQSNLVKTQLDRMMSQGQQLSSQTLKLFEDAYGPMQAKLAASFEKLFKNHH